jgi:hypothetical protein
MTAPAMPVGLFSYSPSTDGHTCHTIAKVPEFDGRCVDCTACTPSRLRHVVHRPDGTTHLVLRCSHCDGPDAHHTIRKDTAA